MKNVLVSVSFLLISVSTFAGQIPASVQKAHEAYLRGDGNALIAEVKSALEVSNNQGAIQKNMLGLYSAAAKNGLLKNVNPNWRLPKELTYAGFESLRRYRADNGKAFYSVAVSLGVQNGASLEQLQVIRYPNQVVIDKAAQIGSWWITAGATATNVWVNSTSTVTPNEEGLYLMNIQIQGQPMVQAWFIMTNKNSSASPVVTSPQLGQAFPDSQPVFQWNAFVSPEHKQGEKTYLNVRVNRAGADQPEVSQVRLIDSKTTSYRYGDNAAVKEPHGPNRLTAGDYEITIAFREVENFGGLELKRTSSTRVPFTVKP